MRNDCIIIRFELYTLVIIHTCIFHERKKNRKHRDQHLFSWGRGRQCDAFLKMTSFMVWICWGCSPFSLFQREMRQSTIVWEVDIFSFFFCVQTHFLMKGYGFQTWELSPVYAIRSYAYNLIHLMPALAIGIFFDKVRAWRGVVCLANTATRAILDLFVQVCVCVCVCVCVGVWNGKGCMCPF